MQFKVQGRAVLSTKQKKGTKKICIYFPFLCFFPEIRRQAKSCAGVLKRFSTSDRIYPCLSTRGSQKMKDKMEFIDISWQFIKNAAHLFVNNFLRQMHSLLRYLMLLLQCQLSFLLLGSTRVAPRVHHQHTT